MGTPPPPPPPGWDNVPGRRPPRPITNPLVGYWQRVVLENYANFQGRARRAEYWWFVLANFIVQLVLRLLGNAAGVFNLLDLLYALAVLIPGLAVAVRRLHDTGRSGAWILLVFLPIVGWIILLVFLATDSTPGVNRYGVSEKYPFR